MLLLVIVQDLLIYLLVCKQKIVSEHNYSFEFNTLSIKYRIKIVLSIGMLYLFFNLSFTIQWLIHFFLIKATPKLNSV